MPKVVIPRSFTAIVHRQNNIPTVITPNGLTTIVLRHSCCNQSFHNHYTHATQYLHQQLLHPEVSQTLGTGNMTCQQRGVLKESKT